MRRVIISTNKDDIYIFRKGKLKGKICTAHFCNGHTVMFDLDGNYLFDYNGGYFDGDNYLRQIGKMIKPMYQVQELRYVNKGALLTTSEFKRLKEFEV